MRNLVMLGLGGVFLAQAFVAPPAVAEDLTGDPAAGRRKAGMCRTCHGLEGLAKIPIAPHIGGEPANYVVRQLIAFRVVAHAFFVLFVMGVTVALCLSCRALRSASVVGLKPNFFSVLVMSVCSAGVYLNFGSVMFM